MGKQPTEIEKDIERTRDRMGETVDALAYRTDVPARLGEAVSEKKEAIASGASALADRGRGVYDDLASEARGTAQRLARLGREHRRELLVGGVAFAGLLVAGIVLSRRRRRGWRDRLVDTAGVVRTGALEAGREAMDWGQEVAREVSERSRPRIAEFRHRNDRSDRGVPAAASRDSDRRR